jgi:hypothetical protein
MWRIDGSIAKKSEGTLVQGVSDFTNRTTTFAEQVPTQAKWEAELKFSQTDVNREELLF